MLQELSVARRSFPASRVLTLQAALKRADTEATQGDANQR
jgi:hypothetical protein